MLLRTRQTKFRTMAGLALLFVWIFAQATVAAHEIVVTHDIESSCEWQCKIGKNDDLIPVSLQANHHSKHFLVTVLNPTSVDLLDIHFSRPYLRAPPKR